MMRLGITLPLDGFQDRHFGELVRHAEKLGYGDAWSYETFAGDAVTPLAAAAPGPDAPSARDARPTGAVSPAQKSTTRRQASSPLPGA